MDASLVSVIVQGGAIGILLVSLYLNYLNSRSQQQALRDKDKDLIDAQRNFTNVIQKNNQVLDKFASTIQENIGQMTNSMNRNTQVMDKFTDRLERNTDLSNNLAITVEALKQMIHDKRIH